jgi:ATP-dependent Lon protease
LAVIRFFDEAFVHLHVPEGATPKDGPSAGVTMASALLSLARNQAPKKGVAMTGELTLTGHVLPIGGVREKVIAARRQKIFELILPEPNRGDFEELPDYLKEGMTVHFAKRFATWRRCCSDRPASSRVNPRRGQLWQHKTPPASVILRPSPASGATMTALVCSFP